MKSREDKKAFKKFIVITLIAFIVGGVFGFCSTMVEGEPADMLAEGIYWFMRAALPYFIPVVLVIQWAFFIVLNRKSKCSYAACGEEDEETFSQIENGLNYIMLVSSIAMVCHFFTMGCLLPLSSEYSVLKYFVVLISYMAGMISCLIMQYKVVAFEKKLNPQKKVSIFDMKFAQKWEDSCDEMERFGIYKSAYRSYRAANMCCIVLWAFCSLGSFIWNFGILPVTMVSIIWMVLVVTYIISAIKFDRSSKVSH